MITVEKPTLTGPFEVRHDGVTVFETHDVVEACKTRKALSLALAA